MTTGTKEKWQGPIFRLALFGLGICSIVLGLQIHGFVARTGQVRREAEDYARNQSRVAAAAIEARLRGQEPIFQKLVEDLNAGRVPEAALIPRLTQALESMPDAFEVGVAYVPYARGPATRLYAPHVARNGGQISTVQLVEAYDYTEAAWFKDGLVQAGWGEPYFGRATKTLVVGYAAPFYRPGSRDVLGVVRVNVSLEHIRRIVADLELGKTGYGFLLSRKGVYLADPIDEYVRHQRTIFDVATERKEEARRILGEKALRGERAFVESVSGVTGQPTWIFSEPLPSMSWSLGVVFIQEEIAPQPIAIRRNLLDIACTSMVFLSLLALLVFRAGRLEVRNLWRFVTVLSLLLVGAIGFTWYVTLAIPDRNGEHNVKVLDQASLRKFVDLERRDETAEGLPPRVAVPTGVSLHTLRFSSANDVVITGYIWQRYDETAARVARGFVFPDAESVHLTESYRARDGDVEVVGWSFSATVRQGFENTLKYPFDRAVVRLRIWPKGLGESVILTPDLDSYRLINSTALPGVSTSLVLPGWDRQSSYFSYILGRSDTLFGLGKPAADPRSAELTFNVALQRQFLDPFISTLLPLLVVTCLLFALLLLITKDKERLAATGFKATDIVRAMVSLLFPVLLAQINLRQKISAGGFIYLEYFYFVMYTVILLVAVNSLAFALKSWKVLQLRDNAVPKLLYWPVVLGSFFAITLVFLY